MQKKKIRCPHCHNSFIVSNPNNVEQLIVTCPSPSCGVKLRVNFATGHTVITKGAGHENGNGFLLYNGQKYPLHEGLNIVGREADSSDAEVQLETDKRYISRKHFGIELVRLKNERNKYLIMDLRDESKIDRMPTLVNGEKLDKVDKIVLSHGCVIEIGEVKMTFNTK